MTQNFFAVCRDAGGLQIKRISVSGTVQADLIQLFNEQEQDFLDDVTEEVEFDGGWNPEDNELLYVNNFPEHVAFTQAITSNAVSADALDLDNFANEPIKAIFTGTVTNGNVKILMQRFTSGQNLCHKTFTLMLQGNTFTKLDRPTFALGSKLVCIIEGTTLKFKSFSNVKAIFDLQNFYAEASDQDIDSFANNGVLSIGDLAAFKVEADQTVRKLVHAIERSNVFTAYTAQDIQTRAQGVLPFALQLSNGMVVMPSTRQEIKHLLHFLDHGLYASPLSGDRFLANSKRRMT